jgi:quinol monooxygenase YgiN
MYGTIAHNRLKPGKAEEFARFLQEGDATEGADEGFVAVFIYRMDSDPDEIWVAAVAESKEAWRARSASPEQTARFQRIREFIEGEPEWHDGEVIFSRQKGAADIGRSLLHLAAGFVEKIRQHKE